MWQLRNESEDPDCDPEQLVRELVEQLEPRKEAIREFVNDPEMCVYIRICCSDPDNFASFTLSSGIMSRLASLCQEFNLTNIGPDPCTSEGE